MVRFTARRLRLRKHLPTMPCASMVRPLLSSSTFFADVVIWLLPYPRHMALLSGLRSFDIGWSSRPSAAAHLARWSAYLRSLFSACADTYIRIFLTIGGILAPTGRCTFGRCTRSTTKSWSTAHRESVPASNDSTMTSAWLPLACDPNWWRLTSSRS